MKKQEKNNGEILEEGLQWLRRRIHSRLQIEFGDAVQAVKLEKVIFPKALVQKNSPLSPFAEKFNPTEDEVLVLLLALAPHIYPTFLDDAFQEILKSAGDFPQFGGARGGTFRGFLPTGETVMFLLAGQNLKMRGAASELFSTGHWFFTERILYLENVKSGEPKMSGKLILDDEWVEKLTTGKISPPALSLTFPASQLQTQLDWEDLILHPRTAAQIEDLHRWIRHSETLMDQYGLGKKLKPGFRALFHGPPGTGKTLTAMLLGKTTGHDVYRIDLSLVVSKYIGETEKNLGTLFDKARSKEWILFFDEADALFGKRTNVRDAHDKYANQEVSYLLQKIEDFPGLVILASNLKTNMDEAFTRRFQSIIYFPIPSVSERLQLWKNAFPEKMKLAKDVDIQSIAQQYELTGSAIMNIVQYACLRALDTKDKTLTLQMIREGIEAELAKEGRVG